MTVTPLNTLSPQDQLTRILEAAKGTCINASLTQEFLNRVTGANLLTGGSGQAARLFETMINSLGRAEGYSEAEIEDFKRKVGITPAKPSRQKATIKVTLELDVEGNAGSFYSPQGDNGIVNSVTAAARGATGFSGTKINGAKWVDYKVTVQQ